MVKMVVAYMCLATVSLGGCYAEGNAFLIGTGEVENFLSLERCEREAQAKVKDGSSRYSGYSCRGKILFWTTEKREYYEGKLTSETR